jgi:leucyl-tRNA synthetase
MFLRLLAPFAPHVTEELWEKLGETTSIHLAPWPEYDPALLVEALVEVVVQVNGKRKGAISIAPDASEADAVSAALNIPAVAAALSGQAPSRTVYVPGKVLNLVL